MTYNSNSLNLIGVKQSFRNVFCNGGTCENYPCLLNTLCEKDKSKIFIEDIIRACPNFYDEKGRPKFDLGTIRKTKFARK